MPSGRQLGLDKPLLTQLSIYVGLQPSVQPGLLQGNLGLSGLPDNTGRPGDRPHTCR